MIILSNDKIDFIKNRKYRVYSTTPLFNNCECFNSKQSIKECNSFYVTSVPLKNIKHVDGKWFYTTEDLSAVSDWFKAHVISVGNNFVPCDKNSMLKCVRNVSDRYGKKIHSDNCVVCADGLPAFNEEQSINEYRFYLTLFNDYTVHQCNVDRKNLHDLKLVSSKYDLESKLQDSNFLKRKDFTMINNKREQYESVKVGLIIKEDGSKYALPEYGEVYINMNNKIYINWK